MNFHPRMLQLVSKWPPNSGPYICEYILSPIYSYFRDISHHNLEIIEIVTNYRQTGSSFTKLSNFSPVTSTDRQGHVYQILDQSDHYWRFYSRKGIFQKFYPEFLDLVWANYHSWCTNAKHIHSKIVLVLIPPFKHEYLLSYRQKTSFWPKMTLWPWPLTFRFQNYVSTA